MQDELKLALGQRIRELRAEQEISQEALADKSGLHRTFMGSVERGERNLNFWNLYRIARGLGISMPQLLTGVEKRAEELVRKPSGKRA